MTDASFVKRLTRLIIRGRNNDAKLMLSPDLVEASSGFGTLLHYAIFYRNGDFARHLIQLGSNVNAVGRGGQTPLLRALNRVFVEGVIILLKAGANVDVVDDFGNSPLRTVFRGEMRWCATIFVPLVRRFQSDCASSFVESSDKLISAGCTVWHAVVLGDIRLLKHMGERNVAVDYAVYPHNAALHQATRVGNVAMARWLLDDGANVDARDHNGISALCYAAGLAEDELVQLLLERGADANVIEYNHRYTTPLWMAAAWMINPNRSDRYVKCVQLLLEHGVVPCNPRVANQPTVFDGPLRRSCEPMVRLLVTHLALLHRLGCCDAEVVLTCNDHRNRAALQRAKSDYEVCQRTLDVVVFGKSALFHLLRDDKNFDRLRIFVRNATFAAKVDEVCSQHKLNDRYNYYYKILMKHIAKARYIVQLEDVAIPIICQLYHGSYNACYEFARRVVGYLNERDLEQLIRFELENMAISITCRLFHGNYKAFYKFSRRMVGYLNKRDLEQLILV